MGNWNINIQGTGFHHNLANEKDADLMAAKFVAELKEAGHTIETASFTVGSKTDLIGVITTPATIEPEQPEQPA